MAALIHRLGSDQLRQWLPLATLVMLVALIGALQPVKTLSGGNQQKVVLAKWLNAKARILILDHPTRGLDVGAKEEVYELVRAVTTEGVAVILTSDTLEETIGLSHTVLVMRDSVITYQTDAAPGHKPTQVDLIGHMV